MQPELIDTFLDLVETRSFNKTAERLGVTQSTVSGRVRTLERQLDARLLERSRSGTRLTTAGLRFEPHARALRLTWAEAVQAVRDSGSAAMTVRIGIQHDLLADGIAGWVTALQSAVPEAALYVEGDYSTQMCADVMDGALDLAIIFSPRPNPDIHFETLGSVRYDMLSTEVDHIDRVRPDRYILANYSPAFSRAHAALLPFLSGGQVSSGQHAVIRGLLTAFGGSAYLLRDTVAEMVAAGEARRVARAPRIEQPVFAVVHLRNRHRRAHRRMIERLRTHLGQARPPQR